MSVPCSFLSGDLSPSAPSLSLAGLAVGDAPSFLSLEGDLSLSAGERSLSLLSLRSVEAALSLEGDLSLPFFSGVLSLLPLGEGERLAGGDLVLLLLLGGERDEPRRAGERLRSLLRERDLLRIVIAR